MVEFIAIWLICSCSLSNKYWLFSFSFQRFPFDINNPLGYLIAVVFEYITIGNEFFVIACTLNLAIGAFWFAISLTKQFQHILYLINEKAHANENQSNELKVLFSEFVYAHGTIIQLSINFQNSEQIDFKEPISKVSPVNFTLVFCF